MGFLDRTELLRQATEAGINQNTFAVYSSYSPILDNPVTDRWVLRGADVSPAAMEAYQSSASTGSRERSGPRQGRCGWSEK